MYTLHEISVPCVSQETHIIESNWRDFGSKLIKYHKMNDPVVVLGINNLSYVCFEII